ncbi:hypothetical protein B0H17DRAFT_167971 [Mycena rosella]|uniref:BAH domain-containing protein n=1 Tax=Mycena rosella TaxID=1033263 RepID=A0AAD7DYN6_MYCRO|nr:hypothetical protein B0H17DRAFT_167971 [Mycena rosella]
MTPAHGHTRRKTKSRTGGESSAPTLEEWDTMEPFGSFVVEGGNGEETVFKLGSTATVLPGTRKVGEALELYQYWLVRILAIRGRNCGNSSPKKKNARTKAKPRVPEYWVKIKWYYSPKEVSCRIAGFKESHCDLYERISSDHFEIVSALTFNELVPIMKFREDDPDQQPIGKEDFFTRYFLRTSSKRCEIESYSSKTSNSKSLGCICGDPYDLKDKSSLHIMYMCPRPQCRNFYHTECLLKCRHWTQMTHPLIRLSCSPDTDEFPVLSPCPSKRRKKKTEAEHFQSLSEAIAALDPPLPEPLLQLAAQPIVRGAALSKAGLGLAGNACAVVAARRMVYAAIQKGSSVPDGWESDLELELDAAVVEDRLPALRLDDTDDALVLMCPNCSGPI